MAPLVPLILLAVGGAVALFKSRPAVAAPSMKVLANDPIGYRRWREGDDVKAEMVMAQNNDLTLPYGTHYFHADGAFVTATENPTGLQKVVTLFVPVAVR